MTAAPQCRIVHGDALDALSKLPDKSVQCVCTDPPYGVSVAGQKWDRRMPGARVWKECVRVMEHGAFAFVMCSPRQDVSARMITTLESAGLDVSYPPILWATATGFAYAKSAAVVARRLASRRGVASRPDVDGSYLGYTPRPAVELVLVCMRPTRDGRSNFDQYADNGLAVTHLDDCRIPYASEADRKSTVAGYYVPADGRPVPPGSTMSRDGKKIRIAGSVDARGRQPSNLLCSGDALNDGRRHGDSHGSFSRYFDLDAWAADHLTPVVTAAPKPRRGERECGVDGDVVDLMPSEAGGGGATTTLLHWIQRGREAIGGAGHGGGNGNEGATPFNRNSRSRLNNHPAVKPVALFAYLMHLGSRQGDTILDPFAGTGTAALAASMTGRRCVAIERSERYAAIARERLQEYAATTRMEAFT